jgi:hypothetical protein
MRIIIKKIKNNNNINNSDEDQKVNNIRIRKKK